MSNRFLRYAILDAGTLVLSGRLFVIFVSGELTFVSGGGFVYFILRYEKIEKQFFFFATVNWWKWSYHWIKNFLFWGRVGFLSHVNNRCQQEQQESCVFSWYAKSDDANKRKTVKRNISCSCDCEEWNLICDWVLIKVLKRTFYKMFDIVGKNVCLEII